MKKLFVWIAAAMMSTGIMAQADAVSSATPLSEAKPAEKIQFTIAGPEEEYNQIRIVNETSQVNFHCRVVLLDKHDEIVAQYGEYYLKEKGDMDLNTQRIRRGQKIGIQMPADFYTELGFSVEYQDLPLFDAIVIRLRDKGAVYNDTF